MTTYEILNLAISSFAAAGTIISSAVALALAMHPRKNHIQINLCYDEDRGLLGFECSIINKGSIDAIVNSITIEIDGTEYSIKWYRKNEQIKFPYKLSPWESILIDDIKKDIFETVYRHCKKKKAKITLNVYDSYGRCRHCFYERVNSIILWGYRKTIIPRDILYQALNKISYDEVAILVCTKDNVTDNYPFVGKTENIKTVLKSYVIKEEHLQDVLSQNTFVPISSQCELNEFVFISKKKGKQNYSADYRKASEIIKQYSIRELHFR